MGVNLRPIVVKKIIDLHALRGRSLAVDANNLLYQFLSLVRTTDGTPLKGPQGEVTSHLAGLMFRSTRIIHEYGIRPVFVFDGKPHPLKAKEIAKRRDVRERAVREWEEALQVGDYATAFSKAVMTSKLTTAMVNDAKRLLDLLGIPYVQAPGEAEAQAAHMAKKGSVWASNSRDYDSLLFGTSRLVRYVTISGVEFLPSKGVSRPLLPEVIELDALLSHLKLTHEQLVDLAILIGTDFNKGVKGAGPKTALRLLQRYGKLEDLPEGVLQFVSEHYQEVRRIFLNPEVTDDYRVEYRGLQKEELIRFMCQLKGFSPERVNIAIRGMKRFHSDVTQTSLKEWR